MIDHMRKLTAAARGMNGGQIMAANTPVNMELLESTINVIRQSLQADGGDVALINCDENGVVTLEMQGACAGCPLSSYDMSEGIERILMEHVPGVTKVQPAMAW
jgi:Fe-S cluster biogenesis protein NfuA